MNETRNIIVGLEIGKQQSQICYFDRKEKEPISISVKTGSNQYLFPTMLSKKPGEEVWHFGMEAQYFSRNEGEIPVTGLLGMLGKSEEILVDGTNRKPEELLEHYLRGCISLLGTADPARQIKAVMITVPKLSKTMVGALYQAGERMGFGRNQIFLQDYDESFYYYVMNHRRDNWNRKIGCFLFEEIEVSFASLVIDSQKRPMTAYIEHGVTAQISQDPVERDENFYRLIARSCAAEPYSSIYIVGDGFDQEWAVRSTPYLCKNQRHVYYGNNLYVKGACYGAREKCDEGILKGYLYLSPSLVRNHVAMEMMVNGSPKTYVLAEAGKNWYEIHTELELILDDREDLEFLVTPMDGGSKTRCSMKLPGLPKRPNKTTRLRVTISYESEELCVIQAEDLGFGEMFPSQGNVWIEKVSW